MSALKLALVDHTFCSLPFLKSLRLIQLLGAERVDLCLNEIEDNLHLVTHTELASPKENGKRMRRIVESFGLAPSDIFMQRGDFRLTALNSPDVAVRKESRKAFRATVEYALACGSDHITIVPGCLFNNDYSGSLKLAASELEWRCKLSADYGISTGIECHVESLVETPQQALDLLEITPGLTLTLDHSHFIRNGATQNEVDELFTHASHLHLRHCATGRLQTIAAESDLDIPLYVRHLKESAFSGVVAMEFSSIEWEDQNKVDTIGETVRLRSLLEKCWISE